MKVIYNNILPWLWSNEIITSIREERSPVPCLNEGRNGFSYVWKYHNPKCLLGDQIVDGLDADTRYLLDLKVKKCSFHDSNKVEKNEGYHDKQSKTIMRD